MNNINITNYRIKTAMGYVVSGDDLCFLSIEEKHEVNLIGHTGNSSDRKYVTLQEYLDSLNKGKFSVMQTKYDNGEFVEEFIITRVKLNE